MDEAALDAQNEVEVVEQYEISDDEADEFDYDAFISFVVEQRFFMHCMRALYGVSERLSRLWRVGQT